MGDISENFSRHEFACKCGCGFDTVDVELVWLCEEVREINGNRRLTPSSGCRCHTHNINVGGSPRSQHKKGRAADFLIPDPQRVYDELCRRHPDHYGFGIYDWGVHVDSRSAPVRWDSRT